MNLRDWEDSLDAADGEPASTSEGIAVTCFIGMCLIVLIAVTVAAIRAW